MAAALKDNSVFAKRYRKLLNTSRSKKILDYVKVCRVCLKKGNIPLLESKADFNVVEALSCFANIKVGKEDTLPKQLCRVCYQFLNAAYLFRNVALQSEDILYKQSTTIKTDTDRKDVIKNEEIFMGKKRADPDTTILTILNETKEEQLETDNELILIGGNKDFSESDDEKTAGSHIRANRKNQQLLDKITCEICKKVVTRSYYKYHKTMHDSDQKFFQCDICGKAFRLRCAYRNHSLRHRSDFSYKCQLCPYQGNYKELLNAHMKIHNQELNYMCTECPAKFRFKSNLNKHIIRHKDPGNKCDRCSKAFHTKTELKQHVDIEHLGIRSHVCNDCSKAFGSRKSMIKHQNRVHKRKKFTPGRMPAYLKAQLNTVEIN